MSSNLSVWDFANQHPTLISEDERGLVMFSCEDAFLERLMTKRIPRQKLEGQIIVISGSELSVSWIEENILTLDLFGSTDHYLVLQSEQIPLKTQTYLLENDVDFSSRLFLMVFNKENDFYKEFSKNNKSLKVKSPQFWEMGKLLSFLEGELRTTLPYPVHQYILDFVPNDTGSFIQVLKNISLHYPAALRQKLSNEEFFSGVKSLIEASYLNKFDLASAYAQKNKRKFFGEILEREMDFDTLRDLFSFMQGHMYKLFDTSYMKKKKKLSKYDREIQSLSPSWTEDEVQAEMRFFGELEILAKRKSDGLINRLRESYLN